MYNNIRNQNQYLPPLRSTMFLMLIFLFPILACTITSSGNESIENEGNGKKDSGWFSNESGNYNDLKQVWDYTRISGEDGRKDVEILQIWENTRKDYWAESIDLSIHIYANDGSLIDSDTQTINISARGTYLVFFEFSGIGSKINRIDTVIDSAYWQISDSDRVKDINVEVSPSLTQLAPNEFLMDALDWIPNLNITTPVALITNNSDYEVNNVQFSVLACTKDEKYCYFHEASNSFSLASEQSRSYSVPYGSILQEKIIFWSPEFHTCEEKNPEMLSMKTLPLPDCFQELIDTAENVSYQYWLTYTSHFGEMVSIEGEIK
jgi:hypothetical protein